LISDENRELEKAIEEKEVLIGQTKSLLRDLCHCGLDRSRSSLNVDYYTQLFDGVLPKWIPGCEQFDPIVYHMATTTTYFCDCQTNDNFLAKCRQLMAAIAELSDEDAEEDDYEAKLRAEQTEFQRRFAHKAVETKRLLKEQTFIESIVDWRRSTGSRHARLTSGSPRRSRVAASPKQSVLFL
jgi:hypothetical protein